jgi:hypothetical protein
MTRKARIWINGREVEADLYMTEIRFGGRQQGKTDALERAPRQPYDIDATATLVAGECKLIETARQKGDVRVGDEIDGHKVVATGETELGDRTVTIARQVDLPLQLEVLEIGTAAGSDYERFEAETKRQLAALTAVDLSKVEP